MKNIAAICFDLDDTLWDLAPVIPRAEEALFDWYEQHYPRVTGLYSPEQIVRLRQDVARRFPELIHDLTELRLRTLRTVAKEAGYPEDMAAEAFAVFQEARNQVDLFADVLPGISRLGERFRIVTLSNGNADLAAIGIRGLFEAAFSAREIGFAKPDIRIFQTVCERLELSPDAVAHVGDHPENDIVAARQAGMHTVWVNRKNSAWPSAHDDPDHVVSCLEELADLFDSQAESA